MECFSCFQGLLLQPEKIVEEWKVKTKKEANLKFNNWINENNVAISDYHLVYVNK